MRTSRPDRARMWILKARANSYRIASKWGVTMTRGSPLWSSKRSRGRSANGSTTNAASARIADEGKCRSSMWLVEGEDQEILGGDRDDDRGPGSAPIGSRIHLVHPNELGTDPYPLVGDVAEEGSRLDLAGK